MARAPGSARARSSCGWGGVAACRPLECPSPLPPRSGGRGRERGGPGALWRRPKSRGDREASPRAGLRGSATPGAPRARADDRPFALSLSKGCKAVRATARVHHEIPEARCPALCSAGRGGSVCRRRAVAPVAAEPRSRRVASPWGRGEALGTPDLPLGTPFPETQRDPPPRTPRPFALSLSKGEVRCLSFGAAQRRAEASSDRRASSDASKRARHAHAVRAEHTAERRPGRPACGNARRTAARAASGRLRKGSGVVEARPSTGSGRTVKTQRRRSARAASGRPRTGSGVVEARPSTGSGRTVKTQRRRSARAASGRPRTGSRGWTAGAAVRRWSRRSPRRRGGRGPAAASRRSRARRSPRAPSAR